MKEYGSQWIEINRPALRHNVDLFRSLISPGTELAAVVKANAYGHGLAEVVPQIADRVDWLAVHSAEEARRVRRLGFSGAILIMGYVPASELFDLDQDMHVVVSTNEVIENLAAYRARTSIQIPIHLKVDTGTRRQGFAIDKLPLTMKRASRLNLNIVGVATHFANIEDTLEHDFAKRQIDVFHDVVELVEKALNERPRWIHAACSAAALLFRETDFSLVRVGISTYGHWSSRETKLSWKLEHGDEQIVLEPALTWRARIGQLQRVPKGETVGYGRSWTALRETVLGVLPVGYADGYPRSLGNQARVIVRGVAAPVVGRVCMNIMMVDITDVEGVEVGDPVVLLGREHGQEITAEELAALSGTINYEFLARLSPDIRRVVIGV